MYTHKYMYVHSHKHTYTHTRTQTHTHTHTHIHTHTHTHKTTNMHNAYELELVQSRIIIYPTLSMSRTIKFTYMYAIHGVQSSIID